MPAPEPLLHSRASELALRQRRFWAPLAVVAACWIALHPVIPLSATQSEAPLDPKNMYVLAFGSCPPWLPEITFCGPDVQQFSQLARDVIGIPAGQITTLVNDEATAQAVRAAFGKLRDSLPQGATVIIYYVGHGMLIPKSGTSSSDAEETFLLWSVSFPFAARYAVQAGIWMTDAELGALVDALPADAALVILDTCDASGAEAAIRSRPSLAPRIALMMSSRAHQIAFTDLTSAVFTRNLVEATRTDVPTLYDAFRLAQKETAAEATTRCEGAGAGKECTPQEAELLDAPGITKRIRLGKR